MGAEHIVNVNRTRRLLVTRVGAPCVGWRVSWQRTIRRWPLWWMRGWQDTGAEVVFPDFDAAINSACTLARDATIRSLG